MVKVFTVDGVEVEVSVDELREKLKEEDEWTVVNSDNKAKYLIYTPNTYIEHVRDYLDQKPPDLKQAGEKIWGLVAHIIKKFFININVAVKSHRATKALALFLFKFHKDGIDLTTFFSDVEWCHKNFYATCFLKDELEEILAKAQEFISYVAEIPEENVKQVLMDHINGKTLNRSLKEVKFQKACITEEFEGKNFTSTFIAK